MNPIFIAASIATPPVGTKRFKWHRLQPVGVALARTKPHRLKPVPLAAQFHYPGILRIEDEQV
jgi:hypothetical protein